MLLAGKVFVLQSLPARSGVLSGVLFFAAGGLGMLATGIYAVIEIRSVSAGVVLLIASAFPAALFLLIAWSLAHIAMSGERSVAADRMFAWIGRGNRPLGRRDGRR